MKYIFGPISSRRFGMSLGIDLSPDVKSCNFDCIYCELDRAKKIDKIENPPKVEDVLKDVKEGIKKYNFDVLTITANGEPTLYPYLDELIDELKKLNKKLLILAEGEDAKRELFILNLNNKKLSHIFTTKETLMKAKFINNNKIFFGLLSDEVALYDLKSKK